MKRLPALVSLTMLLAASSACATTQTLSADVDYDFRDSNGVGWVTQDGKVSVTFIFAGKDGTLKISGKRRSLDSLLTDDSPDGLETTEWEGDVDETYPLLDVERTRKTFTFEFDLAHDHLTGSCAPTKIDGLAHTTLYECRITGFQWKANADLPELHHPIVLDANPEAQTRVVNSMTGSTTDGQRIVREE
jgi:hypothetical protein